MPTEKKIAISICGFILICCAVITAHEVWLVSRIPVIEWQQVQDFTVSIEPGGMAQQPVTPPADIERTLAHRFTVDARFPVSIGRVQAVATTVPIGGGPWTPINAQTDCAQTDITQGAMTCNPNGNMFTTVVLLDRRPAVPPVVAAAAQYLLHQPPPQSNIVHVRHEVFYCVANCEHLKEWMAENHIK